jgi:hypothetical protein
MGTVAEVSSEAAQNAGLLMLGRRPPRVQDLCSASRLRWLHWTHLALRAPQFGVLSAPSSHGSLCLLFHLVMMLTAMAMTMLRCVHFLVHREQHLHR